MKESSGRSNTPLRSDKWTWIGLAVIVIGFLITRLPFFIYMPLPGLFTDSGQYYNVLSIIEQRIDRVVGIPQFGYPFILKLCEQLVDTLWFVVLMQFLLALVAACWFYLVYARTFGRWRIYAALLLFGHLASRMSLFWDTFIYPDSVLASLYLICAAILMDVMVNRRYGQLALYSVVMTVAIAVRPSGLVLIPPFVVAVFMMVWHEGKWREALRQTAFMASGMLLLCVINSQIPSHNKFAVFVRGPKPAVSKVIAHDIDHPMLHELARVVPHSDIVAASNFHKVTDADSLVRAYYSYVKKPVAIAIGRIDVDTVLYYRNGTSRLLDLDSIALQIGDTAKYRVFRDSFQTAYADTVITFGREKDLRYGLLHFPMFFRFFLDVSPFGPSSGNDDFYAHDLGKRWITHYVDMFWVRYSLRDYTLVALEQVTRRTAKEIMVEHPMSMEQAQQIHRDLLDSNWYRIFLEPYYKVHPLLFRNHLYIVGLFLALLLAVILALRSLLCDRVAMYTIAVLSMLFATLVIHLFIFKLIYDRYTYQITFVYYFAAIMLPHLLRLLIGNRSNPNEDAPQ